MFNLTRMFHVRALTQVITVTLLGLFCSGALAQKNYDPGASDGEIKLGNIAPYSSPVSALSVISKTEAAYFKMINAQGGVGGRKINFISYDDGYSPPKTIEQARKLVESDEVLALVSVAGTPGNAAIQKYANSKKVPQFFIVSRAARFADPKAYPWSMGWNANYPIEARIYARYVQENYPGRKIEILYQNDDFGKDYITGLREGVGSDAAKLIVSEIPYEVTVPTVESHIAQTRSANPDIFLNFVTSKFAAQAIRKIGEMGWKPVQFLSSSSASIEGVLRPAGLDNAQGILTAISFRDPNDAQWIQRSGRDEMACLHGQMVSRGRPEGRIDLYGVRNRRGDRSGLNPVWRRPHRGEHASTDEEPEHDEWSLHSRHTNHHLADGLPPD
jgi:branched-chain amino acid transport system substrate-binding protein